MPLGNLLQGYEAARQGNQAGAAADLQQFGTLQQILAKQGEAQRADEMRKALAQSGGDPDKAMQILLQTGNVAGAHALAPVIEASRKAKMDKMLLGLTPDQLKDPTVLRQLGVHDPRFMAEADRLEKLRADASTLDAMKGVGTPVQRVAIPAGPDQASTDAAALAQFNAMPPGPRSVQALPSGVPTDTSGVTVSGPRSGGIFDDLTQSPNPQIAQQAASLKAAMEKAGPSIPSQYWQSQQSALATRESSLLNRPAEPLQSYIDPATGKPRLGTRREAYGNAPASAAAVSNVDVINPDNAHLHGAEYIATLPPGMQNVVRGLIDYKLPITALSSRTGERKAAFEHAAQADPNFNVAKYTQRQKVMNDFTSGTVANNLTALDQALNHMGTLSKLATAMQNNDIPAVNSIVNMVKTQTGNPQVTNASVAQMAVGTELMRVFRQVNASEVETKDWMSKFPLSGSPAQVQQALGVGAKLLEGRVNALNNRWNNGMDVETGYPKIMSPQARQSLDQLTGKVAAPSSTSGWSIRPK